jgi:hypothetical protein
MFSYFSGNIKHVRPLGVVSFDNFIKAHKNPTAQTLNILNQIKLVGGDKVKKRSLKGQLYAFTPTVQIIESRRIRNIVSFSGYTQLDFDKLESVSKAEEFRDYIFETYPMISAAYLSPSRNGVKCLINIPRIKVSRGIDKAVNEYRDYYRAIISEFGNYDGFDEAPKNVVLPLFISEDKNIRYRHTFDVWDIKEDAPIIEQQPNLNYTHKGTSKAYFYEKTVRIFTDKINGIVENAHPQLLRACLVLGSRAGAGYIDLLEAEHLAMNLVTVNGYMAKGTDGYLKTAIWAVNEGYKRPREY